VVGEGQKQKTFEIYKGLLSYYSDYFRAALNGRFSEAQEGVISLPTEDAEIFGYFKNWVYTHKLTTGEESDLKALAEQTIRRIYVFADRRQIPLLGNECLNLVHSKIADTWTLSHGDVPYLYEHLLPGNGLRRFMIDSYAVTMNQAENGFLDGDEWTLDSLRELTKALVTRPKFEGQDDYAKRDVCQYHVHTEGVRCESSKTV